MKEHSRKVIFSSKSDEWETPDALFEKLNWMFDFTLDPCATPQNTKCENYYTKEDDGLSKSWLGERVFINPPYSQIDKWVDKAFEEAEHAFIVMLLPSRTDRPWFTKILNSGSHIFFIEKRLKFKGAKSSAPFPSVVVCIIPEGVPLVFSVNRDFISINKEKLIYVDDIIVG